MLRALLGFCVFGLDRVWDAGDLVNYTAVNKKTRCNCGWSRIKDCSASWDKRLTALQN